MHGTKFYRPARAYPPLLPASDIVISSPPTVQPTARGILGVLQYLLPVVGSVGFIAFAFINPNPVFIAVYGLMGVSMIGSGIGMGVLQRSMQKKQRTTQSTLYNEYISQSRTRLQALSQQQYMVGARLYPSYTQLVTNVKQRASLWERRPDDVDFLNVRVGVGPGSLCCPIYVDLGTDPMTQFVPELRVRAESLVAEYSYLDEMPSVIPLRAIGTLSIQGARPRTRALVQAMLCQIVASQSPEDVRCMVYFPEEALPSWSWLKWLPHVYRLRQVKAETRYAPDHVCMLATTVDDVRELLINQIKPELDRRRRLLEDRDNNAVPPTSFLKPHLVVILDGFTPHGAFAQMPELDELFRDASKLGATVISLADDISQEPAQLQARLSISNVGWLDFAELRLGGIRREGITPDAVDPQLCEQIARSLTPLTLAEAGAQQDLSQDIRLLDLLSIPSAEAVHIPEVWQPRAKQDLLRVPLGRRADGEPLMLDIKEAAERGMGPHGLIVGATGSGKSELLRTLVVSMAATHDPQDINFVLVDFKGGASFADFASLPHVAGIVTNIEGDLTLVDRVYSSLLGEQQRRQRLLHDAGNLDNVQQYQAKAQKHPEMEPMPHLLVIADEFAELIVNRPDFLELFVTMGRVGRSLGTHLLLATQRLDEGRIRGLEGHLRYRICLRTFSAPESSSVLGNRDAYYLPSAPGIGYFKVDTDIYSLFKTALISVPYVPASEQVSLMSQVREFTPIGKLVKHHIPTSQRNMDAPSTLHTEMDVVIEHLSEPPPVKPRHPVHQVWLPPMSKMLPLKSVLRRRQLQQLDGSRWLSSPPFGELRIPIGLLDMPLEQAQEPLILDFSGAGGHLALVGAPQTGKSTFLRTLVASFMVTHSPYDVQIYCIDLGGGLLRIFEQAPHIGTVCSKSERDKLLRVIRQMRKTIEQREFLFREQRIDSMATFRMRRQAGELADFPFGDVFLIIDNFGQLVQDFDLEAEITDIVASGLTYGVHVIIAANRWPELRPKLRDNIGTRLELRLNDPLDSEFGKVAASSVPIGVPGRGINQKKLLFQAALPILGNAFDAEEGQDSFVQPSLEALVQRASQAWKGEPAAPIRMLPSIVQWQRLPAASANQPAGVPIGLEEFRLDPAYIDLISGSGGPHFIVLGDSESGKTTLLRTWMRGIEQRYSRDQASFAIVDYRKTLLDFAESKHLLTYAYHPASLTECVGSFGVDLGKRMMADADVPLTQLRSKRSWSGRHFFLFVDDYDSVVSPSGNPFNPLMDFLLGARDIGFHVVLTRRVGGVGRAAFEPFFQRLKEMGSSALIMSGDAQEGKILHGVAATLLPPGRGYLAQRSHPPTLVQVAMSEPAYANEAR